LLRVSLEQFPGVKLIPFGWVALAIFLYVLLIGPGDYFFLRKVLKRMEYTWITFPLLVIVVSGLAYSAAFLFKGKELLVNKVDVVDIDQVAKVSRGTTFVNLFSPMNRDYTLGAIPGPLDRDVAELAETGASEVKPGEKSRPRPPAGTEVVTSWFGVPERQFGGMTGPPRPFSFAATPYRYLPESGAEAMGDVRVPIWSTQAFLSRWFSPTSIDVIEADLQPVGSDRLSGTVRNRLDVPLKDVLLAFGKQVYLLEELAPGASVLVQLKSDRNLSGLLKSRLLEAGLDKPLSSKAAKADRAALLLSILFHDSESTVGNDMAVANNPLAYLDMTSQLALDRPVLIAQIDRPGTQLVLGNAPGRPKSVQTTLLRVVLPLKTARRSN
jgi:hypothetical protein